MPEENSEAETPTPEDNIQSEKFDVLYSCLRCATIVTNTELSRLPEIKWICGFRFFTKGRPPIVKSIKPT